MNFEIISEISEVQIIAKGHGVDIRRFLLETYGYGNWRKLKGIATIEYENGQVWLAEIHYYEAHGIGKRRPKVKREIKRYK